MLHASPSGWDWDWLSLVALQAQYISFKVVLIDISCYCVLFINLQGTVNATGEADCKLFCDNDALKRKHYGKLIVNFGEDSYVPPESISFFILLPTWLPH